MAKQEESKDKYLIEYFSNCKKEEEEVTARRRDIWNELWMLYQNRQDYGRKANWQSRCFIPKIYMTVEQASSIVKRAVVHLQRLFGLKPPEVMEMEMEAPVLDDYKEKLRYVDRSFKHKLERSNFRNVFGDVVKSAFLLGLGVLKINYEGDGLLFENKDILLMHIDPDFQPFSMKRPRYIIEEKLVDLPELRRMAIEINEAAGKQIYKISEIDKIEADFHRTEELDNKNNRMGLLYSNMLERKKVLIWECWGDIPSKDGKKYKKENRLVVIANEKYVIRNQDNPYDMDDYPYELVIPIPYPHRGTFGNSLVEPMVRINLTINNIINMMVDNLNFSVNKTFVANRAAFANPDQITNLYPGKLMWSLTDAANALHQVKVDAVGADSMNIYQLLESEGQKASGVTEFLMGQRSPGEKTATEVELKSNQAQGMFNVIVKDIEDNNLKPILRKIYNILMQFEGFPDIDFDIIVGGISLLMNQKGQTEKVMQVISLISQTGQLPAPTVENPGQTVMDVVDTYDLVKKMLEALDIEDALRTQEEITAMNQKMQEQMQQMQQQEVAQAQDQNAMEEQAIMAESARTGMPPENIMAMLEEQGGQHPPAEAPPQEGM